MTRGWDSARKVPREWMFIRRSEECVVGCSRPPIPRPYHLYIGQEATGVAVMEALSPLDRLRPLTANWHTPQV
jgi:TPP-dependent pyruvate/acetoin dehydrogenase alpha subunit